MASVNRTSTVFLEVFRNGEWVEVEVEVEMDYTYVSGSYSYNAPSDLDYRGYEEIDFWQVSHLNESDVVEAFAKSLDSIEDTLLEYCREYDDAPDYLEDDE